MRRLATVFVLLAACGGRTAVIPTFSSTTSTTAITVPTTSTPVSTPSTNPASTVEVFYSTDSSTTCSEVLGFERVVPAGNDRMRAAFEQLLAGPTRKEEETGVWSWFGPDTTDVLGDLRLAGGRLTIDFADFSTVIPNASSSCGSAALLAQLTTTAFQFEEVDSVSYTFDGSCEAFGEFLQMGCVEIARGDWPPGITTDRFEAGSPDLYPPDPLPGSEGAAGSGCTPDGDDLPDGIWFGTVVASAPDSLDFDLSCFFFGDAANRAAAEDGAPEIPVPNDYYIRNENPATRTVPVATDAVIHSLGASIDDGYELMPWSEWLTMREAFISCPGDSCIVWLYINDGAVTEIVEQYTP